MTEDDRLRPPPFRLLGAESSAEGRLYSKDLEEVVGDRHGAEALRLAAPAQDGVPDAVKGKEAGDRRQRLRPLAQIQHVADLGRLAREAGGIVVGNPYEALGFGERQGPQQQGVDDAEDGGTGANPQAGDRDGEHREPCVAPQGSDGIAKILAKIGELHGSFDGRKTVSVGRGVGSLADKTMIISARHAFSTAASLAPMYSGAPDERLSKYEIIRPLGSGGMGVVYLALDTVLNREVAIKFVSADRIADPVSEQRLLKEAQAAAALDHPSICAVYDVHMGPDGRACIVMQYVEGETLAERLLRGPLAPRQALALATDIAEALAVAHARHVVHRDLKPQNIMVTPSGRPKLLDFGIALIQTAPVEAESPDTQTSTSATTGRAVVGSPAYMSPEQILQRPLDGRSDLFSLGLILFECLTGRSAFRGASKVETWSAILHTEPPKASSLAPDLSDAHDELCRRLMAKDPAERFQSAEELVGALRLLGPSTRDTTGTHAAPSRRRSRALAGLAAVLLAATAFVTWRINRPPALPEPSAAARVWYDIGTAIFGMAPTTARSRR